MHISLSSILVFVLALIFIAALPAWPHSAQWGYGPGGVVSLFLIVAVILALTGRI